MATFKYPALRTKQTSAEKYIVLLSASAEEVEQWAGVPQKKSFADGAETAGFQREENKKRLASLGAFFSDSQNVIQNTLLCATRASKLTKITFEPTDDQSPGLQSAEPGTLVIDTDDITELSLRELLELLADDILDRLQEQPESNPLLPKLKLLAAQAGHHEIDPEPESDSDEQEAQFESALFEESHLLDFWAEIDGRAQLLRQLGEAAPVDAFLGFTRSDILEQLKPVVLVDGQHRLRGALHAAELKLEAPDVRKELENRIANGEEPDSVHRDLLKQHTRPLPISILLADNPEEQVFQFVIVNQKATPIGRALLGTIVSTTLTTDEMSRVVERLTSAGIEVEESKAITFMARSKDSPFFELIERGLTTDNTGGLQWNVAASLISIFRNLSGGSLFGLRVDYADAWRKRLLDKSLIAQNYKEHGCESQFEYWSSYEGPWRGVFIAFFRCIRDRFANTQEPSFPNYWGDPRSSNLFNKVSLTILAADFFQYLVTTKKGIDNVDEIAELVDDWLEGVNPGYFNKDWELEGVKRDSTGIRNRWAEVWTEYRKFPEQLPDKRIYRNPKRD